MTEPRTVLPSGRVQPRFAGLCTFGRYPRIEDVDASRSPVDWAIYGVPFDSAVTYRPGTRFGPRAMRDASQYLKPYSIEHDVNIAEVLSLADAGDAPVRPYSNEDNLKGVFEHASSIGGPETKLLALGGDHSIAYANIRATWERQGSPRGGLPLIHFDSHLDTVDVVWGDRWSHASPFIRAIEDGLIDPKRMVSIGIKGPLNTAADLDYARDHGVEIITHPQWQQDGPARLARVLDRLGTDPSYITFDIDVVDPAYAPGTGTPSHGGFTSAEVFAILRSLAGVRLAGADVVEVLPDRDVNQNTALLAAHVAFEILCLDAVSRRTTR
ncbi:MAG: agmatinase [Planctomycetota bacterium]